VSGPFITFLTDYGLHDEFVGTCHAVIAQLCPQARVIDLTHGIPRHDVRAGAIALADAHPYLPRGVRLAVVDPEVGAARRAVALTAADGTTFVGPDNGLLWPAAAAAGGIVEAAEISHSPWRLEPVSATFHGRDIFSPVAAQLAAGHPLAEAGQPLDAAELTPLELPRAEHRDGALAAVVLGIDGFGNVQLAATHEDVEEHGLKLGRRLELTLPSGDRHVARFVRAFAEAPAEKLIVYEDAARRLAIAINYGNAGERLDLRPGAEIVVRSVTE
jgi:S-adenosylmethionine hydrolase